jgi:Integrase repeat unit
MTNARCLTEGVDVPAIDCVMFADPKQSRVDIVQAAGRALRRYEGKEHGYIVVPLVVPEKMDFDKFAETTAFKQVAQTITALSTQDERITDEFRAIEQGRVSNGKIVEIEGDIPVGMKMKLGDFAEAISAKLWESVGRVNWRNFEDARVFVHGLGLKSFTEWFDYSQSGKKPPDIPANPQTVYTNNGWAGFDDWLGTGRRRRGLGWQRFKDARAFARSLSLESVPEWFAYTRSGKKPPDIPSHPERIYAKDGWAGWGDWLGTGTLGPWDYQFRSFKKARAFARSLGLKNDAEWFAYTRSRKKPPDIPANPRRTYANSGFVSMGNWLGTGRVANQFRKYRSFKKARAFVLGLGLKSRAEWVAYCKSGKKPADIPAGPRQTYAKDGWAGWGDWLGTKRRRGQGWRSFPDARAFAHSLGLKSGPEWLEYCQSGMRPTDIPSNPNQVYATEGYRGMGDWLGYSHLVIRPSTRRPGTADRGR